MNLSKENVFKIEYTSVLGNVSKEKWTSKLLRFIIQNKIISIVASVFVLCFGLNLTLIYNFIKILENM